MQWAKDNYPDLIPDEANGFTINWEKLFKVFPILGQLKRIPQDGKFHGEGNVLQHTRMVVESLTRDDRWLMLERDERAEVWLAALLHDIGKAKTSIIEKDGGISSPNHSLTGARMARELLYTSQYLKIPFFSRERIVNFVRYHGLPLWVFDRENPRRFVLLTSQLITLHNLYILSYNDIVGRISNDTANLIYKLEIFKEFCKEQNCYNEAYPFADFYTRYLFAQGKAIDPSYPAYDNSCVEVIMLSGLPGSGKDTWITKNNGNLPVISLDEIRRAMKISPEDDQGRIVQQAKEQARKFLRSRQSFIWNATNIKRITRSSLLELFLQYHARVKLVYVECPFAEMMERNQKRKHMLPDGIILNKLKKLEVPQPFEAHSVNYSTY